jgi:hypothetical protein
MVTAGRERSGRRFPGYGSGWSTTTILKRDEAEVPALAGLRLGPQDLFHDGLVRGIAGATVTVADPLP